MTGWAYRHAFLAGPGGPQPIPAALAAPKHHAWYRATFADYPRARERRSFRWCCEATQLLGNCARSLTLAASIHALGADQVVAHGQDLAGPTAQYQDFQQLCVFDVQRREHSAMVLARTHVRTRTADPFCCAV